MKKSDLKKHIKEEILSILKEASTALVTTKGGTKPVSFTSPTELNALKTDSNVTSITTTAGQKIKETESTETYMISKAGSKGIPYYVLEKPDGSKQIDMMFSSPEEAKKYATKKNLKLSSKKGYNMNEAKEINGIPGTVTIGGGKSGILIPTNQGDYIYYVTDDEYNAFINAGGNAQKLMATIFLKSGKAKPYKPKYNPMASLGGGKGYHIDEDKNDDKITNLEKYTYTLNGKKVTPEIGYFDHSLKAMISTPRSGDEYFDYEFYRIGEPDESGNIELSPEKGKKGMYTEEMDKNSYEVVWTDRDYKQHSKVFKNDPQGSSENAKMKATKFLKSLEDKDKKSEYGLYRSITLKEGENSPIQEYYSSHEYQPSSNSNGGRYYVVGWDEKNNRGFYSNDFPNNEDAAYEYKNSQKEEGINPCYVIQVKTKEEVADKLKQIYKDKGVKFKTNEAKIESDFFEREPKTKDIEKGDGIIAKTTRLLKFQKELKTLSKDMQDLAAEYREAEGSDKDEILRTLKVKTAAKKELEKKIEQLEKYI